MKQKSPSYISSLVTKYGDVERVKQDVNTLNEILGRQGSSLLIDVIAEHVGTMVVTHKLTDSEGSGLAVNLSNELKESILERV